MVIKTYFFHKISKGKFCPKKAKFFQACIVVCSSPSKGNLVVFAGSDLIWRGLATSRGPHNTRKPI
jgi:hypothetical protein